MKLVQTAVQKQDSEKYNDTNFLISKPELFEAIYGVKPITEMSLNGVITLDTILFRSKRIIVYTFDDGSVTWENMKEHKLRMKFLNMFKKKKLVYNYGYITGTQSPTDSKNGMYSGCAVNGYKFWQKIKLFKHESS